MIEDITKAIADKCIKLDVQKIYTENIPQNYDKPSLFVDFIRPINKVLNNATRQVDYHYQLIYLAPTDAHGNSKRSVLFNMSESLRHCFSDAILDFQGEILKLEYTDGEIVRDGITSDLVVTTYQTRVFRETGEEIYPVIEEVIIKR